VAFIQKLLTQNRIRIIGVCFGHQIVGRAMGQTVARNEKGWEVTVTPLELTERGREVFGCESLVGFPSLCFPLPLPFIFPPFRTFSQLSLSPPSPLPGPQSNPRVTTVC